MKMPRAPLRAEDVARELMKHPEADVCFPANEMSYGVVYEMWYSGPEEIQGYQKQQHPRGYFYLTD